MDWQWLFNAAFAALGGVIAWVVRMLWIANAEVRKDLHSLERELPQTYIRRDDFHLYSAENRREHDEIKGLLRIISEKLDGKVDRQ